MWYLISNGPDISNHSYVMAISSLFSATGVEKV